MSSGMLPKIVFTIFYVKFKIPERARGKPINTFMCELRVDCSKISPSFQVESKKIECF